MKKIEINEYGSAAVLKSVESDIPVPGAGEILIRATAIGLNFSDVLRRKNTYFMPTPLPYTLGSEAVGEIVKNGSGVPEEPFTIGSKVLAILPWGGGYAEYIIAKADYCVPLPPNMKDRDATSLFVQGSTAHLMVNHVAGDLKGKTVLVHAASGGVGSLIVQLAKLAGAKVIAAASNSQKLEKARELGADLTINYTDANWVNNLIEQNQGEKVDCIFEMAGGRIFEECIETLKPGGTIIVYGSASGQKGFIHSERFVGENQNLMSFNLAYYVQHKPELWQKSLGAMIELIASGKIKVGDTHSYSLANAALAHRDLEERKTTGKVVLLP